MSFSDYLASGGKVLNEAATKRTIQFFDIQYDTDGESAKELGLPSKMTVKVNTDFDVNNDGADLISDKTGQLVTGFKFKEIVNEAIDPKHAPDGRKLWHRMDNVGKAKYTINFHDGVKTHPDGSKFYDMRIFKNKPDMEAFITDLSRQGYREGKSPLYEAAGDGKLPPGIGAVRQALGLESGSDTSMDDEILAMSFKEYLDKYLQWEGIIGYTGSIVAIANALHDKK